MQKDCRQTRDMEGIKMNRISYLQSKLRTEEEERELRYLQRKESRQED